jgi:hypothetical protein
VQIVDNPHLGEIHLFTDRLGALQISRNAVLDSVNVFLDAGDGDVTLTDNPRVDSLYLDRNTGLFGPVEIAGSLTLSGPFTSFFSFGALTIDRNLTIEGTQLTDIAPIKKVGGSLRILHNALFRGETSLSLGGSFELVDNAVIDHVFLFDAETLNGHVIITDNNPAVIEIGLGHLEQVDGSLLVAGNTLLPGIAVPRLAFGRDLTIDSNPALTQLELGALVQASSLRVRHNHVLPACGVTAIFAHVNSAHLDQSDNDDTATCTAGAAGAHSTPGE